jgi:hypothetical protein
MARRGYSSRTGGISDSDAGGSQRATVVPLRRQGRRKHCTDETCILIASKSTRPGSTREVTRSVIMPAILELVTPFEAARAGGQG